MIPGQIRRLASLVALVLIIAAAGCGRGQNKVLEVAYVSAPQVNLRDRVSALYNKTGTLKNGERVDVLERSKRFVRVRNAACETGWVEQRYLVGQDVYRDLQQLAQENRNAPMQATAVARASLKIHVKPGRDTESLIQLKEGDKVQVLKRATVEKAQPMAARTDDEDPPGRRRRERSRRSRQCPGSEGP